jgi:phospho-N-acetylmuramoyl-pentapeptide-transferase
MNEAIVLNVPAMIKVFSLTGISFIIAFLWTPLLTNILFKYKIWKKVQKEGAPIFNKLHAHKENTPVMGGLLIWITALVVTLIFNLSRSQTYLPLFALVTTGILGFVDDYLNVRGIGQFKGVRARYKILWLLIIAGFGAWWFYSKLGWGVTQGIHIPGIGDFAIGLWYIPLFIFVIVAAANAVNLTDGLDGLAGGLLAMAFLFFGTIAFVQQQFGIAAFCGTISGATIAFLWFNIYPARFFMGDTGSLSLGATLGVVAMLTNSVVVLPIIGFVFLFETLSVIVQRTYKKITGGKKLILSSPIHNHLQAIGWHETKVTTRFWLIGAISGIIGLAIALIGRG